MPDDGELDLDLPPVAPRAGRRRAKDPQRIYRRNGAESTGPPYGYDDLPVRVDAWRDETGNWSATASRYFVERALLWDDDHPRLASVLEAWRDPVGEWEVGLRVAVYDRPSRSPRYDTWNAWTEAFACYGDDGDDWTSDLAGLYAAVAQERLVETRPNRYL